MRRVPGSYEHGPGHPSWSSAIRPGVDAGDLRGRRETPPPIGPRGPAYRPAGMRVVSVTVGRSRRPAHGTQDRGRRILRAIATSEDAAAGPGTRFRHRRRTPRSVNRGSLSGRRPPERPRARVDRNGLNNIIKLLFLEIIRLRPGHPRQTHDGPGGWLRLRAARGTLVCISRVPPFPSCTTRQPVGMVRPGGVRPGRADLVASSARQFSPSSARTPTVPGGSSHPRSSHSSRNLTCVSPCLSP